MKCSQPNCTGTIQDGYCDRCGAPAGAQPFVEEKTAKSAAAGTSGLTTASSRKLASAPIGSAVKNTGSTQTRRLSGSSTRRVARLGAGLTTVPPTAVADPATAVMAVAEVAEEKRFCPACEAPVGRSRPGKPGRTEGFCPKCRTQFSFSPKLQPGDLVGGQYAIVGVLAHGGLGWIYLARDKNVSDRYVVLKGLLNVGDADAYAAAIAEQQFLAQVQHPLIVEIYNFVLHEGAGYIVMEYVGGKSLKSLLKDRMKANGGKYDALPVDQAIAYIVEVLPAFSYLHGLGLLYCDFKPDNIIQSGDAIKLIDLGGVRRADDTTSSIYGTVGFQAPEVATLGPSIASDIYTLGRTLAVLAMDFRGYQSTYVASLPDVADTDLFQNNDSFYRVLAKACAPNPDDRFQSADELRDQLLGVLREVMAAKSTALRATHSAASSLFDAPVVAGDTLDWSQLPALRVDPADPMAAWLAGVSIADPTERIAAFGAAAENTVEVHLAMARAMIEAARPADAGKVTAEVLAADPWEWRAVWMNGLVALASGDHAGALAAFNTVYGEVPGELAPKLALALACELSGQGDVAEQLYMACARTDANYTAAAAFGLARIRASAGNTPGALAALDLVPATSASFVASRRRRAELLTADRANLAALDDALTAIVSVSLDPTDRFRLRIKALEGALANVQVNGDQPKVTVGGVACDEVSLRLAAEAAYRHAASLTDVQSERHSLADVVNRIRPRTML